MLSEHFKISMDKFFEGLQLVPTENITKNDNNVLESKIDETNELLRQLLVKVEKLLNENT